ncbi:MAG TPA: branched-chain amino acid ABC transporter permease [Acidimicrobiaceae bacterium]|nr:branched-chain amino acid ABC transporter permease [Acidimicrobiaceae bacterium]HCV34594.1 branched-chain amino acid ABC transporter permease [Acidimicrobiaceae bacterium]
MRGRPNLYISYESESQLMPTLTKKVALGLFLLILVLMPFDLPVIDQIPFIRFLGDNVWLRLINRTLCFAIAALGLNILMGLGGQISIGHTFFGGVGAYTAVLVGGKSSANLWGWGLPMWVWLPAAGIIAALVGIAVAPAAVRVRGLYLGIVTLGLVFIGLHLSRVFPEIAGPGGLGRKWPRLELRLWKEEEPLVDFSRDGHWFWFDINKNEKTYLFLLAIVVVMAWAAANLARSRTGRALQAIRDRDIAAEIMGVPEYRYKTMAFAISSFYAGIGGAVFASFSGQLPPEQWSLIGAVNFVAALLIGGMGRVSGVLMGSFFVITSHRFVEEVVDWMKHQAEHGGLFSGIFDFFVSTKQGDGGFVSVMETALGYPLPVSALDEIIFGLLIIFFLLFEPLGLYGVWVKVRNYWKGWPFSY